LSPAIDHSQLTADRRRGDRNPLGHAAYNAVCHKQRWGAWPLPLPPIPHQYIHDYIRPHCPHHCATVAMLGVCCVIAVLLLSPLGALPTPSSPWGAAANRHKQVDAPPNGLIPSSILPAPHRTDIASVCTCCIVLLTYQSLFLRPPIALFSTAKPQPHVPHPSLPEGIIC